MLPMSSTLADCNFGICDSVWKRLGAVYLRDAMMVFGQGIFNKRIRAKRQRSVSCGRSSKESKQRRIFGDIDSDTCKDVVCVWQLASRKNG